MPRGQNLSVASLLDIAGTKAAVVQRRPEERDYVDIDALIRHGIDLPHILAAGAVVYGRSFNPLITLKALSYFDDVPKLAEDVRRRLSAAAAAVDVRRLPALTPDRPRRRNSEGAVRPLPVTPETVWVARRVVWFEEPESALADPVRFLTYVMVYGTVEDLRALDGTVAKSDYREALERAPPGIFDPRSWAYWNRVCGRQPAPPMPTRFGLEPSHGPKLP